MSSPDKIESSRAELARYLTHRSSLWAVFHRVTCRKLASQQVIVRRLLSLLFQACIRSFLQRTSSATVSNGTSFRFMPTRCIRNSTFGVVVHRLFCPLHWACTACLCGVLAVGRLAVHRNLWQEHFWSLVPEKNNATTNSTKHNGDDFINKSGHLFEKSFKSSIHYPAVPMLPLVNRLNTAVPKSPILAVSITSSITFDSFKSLHTPHNTSMLSHAARQNSHAFAGSLCCRLSRLIVSCPYRSQLPLSAKVAAC
jgi:hypothetical protein